MRNLMLALMLLSLPALPALAQESGIQFSKGTWNELLAKAKKENKLLFIDCYTSWCGPCKKLAKEVFTQKKMGDFFNAEFINVSMDMEKGVGVDLAKKYEVKAFPTLLIVNLKGYKVGQIVGFWAADTLINWSQRILKISANITDDERFDNGDRSEVFMNDYFSALIKNDQIQKARIAFYKLIKDCGTISLYKRQYWELLELADVDSEPALYFVANRKVFSNIYGEKEVKAKIHRMYISQKPLTKIWANDFPRIFKPNEYKSLITKMTERKLPDLNFLISQVDFYVKCRSGKIDEALGCEEKLLKDAESWKLIEAASLANWVLNTSRDVAAKWALRASTKACTPLEISEAVKLSEQLSSTTAGIDCIPTTIVLGRKLFGL